MSETIKATVHRVIAEHLCVEPERVKDETVLTEELGADSLDVVELQMAFEDEFDLEFVDSDMTDVRTVADAVALIERKRSA